MNTLREILEFVGLSGPQKFFPLLGNTGFTAPTMRTVGLQVPVLTNDQRSSMRAMIIGLQNLPPIGLEADGEALAGEVPFRPIVHVQSSSGVILETIGNIFQNGVLLFASSRDFGSSDASMAIVQLNDPGFYQFEVTRVGIPNTGITTLTKTFDVIARAKPEPSRPLKEPTISVTTEGAGAGTVLVVSGSGFLPNRTVTVRVADEQLNPERNFQQSSTASGELRMRISLPCNSGLSFHVSATDSRPGPGILGVVFSNNVKLLCP